MASNSSARGDRSSITKIGVAFAMWVVVVLGLGASFAHAGTAEEVSVLPVLDSLKRTESPLSNEGKWLPLSWATGTKTGAATTSGWGPVDTFSTINGAYWNPATYNDSTGSGAAMTMQTGPGAEERYVSLWIDMPEPEIAKAGYQLQWTVNKGLTTYTVVLNKWVGGTKTELAKNTSVTVANGSTMAITDTGGTVTAWKGTGEATPTSLLSAADTTYSAGLVGVEGSGNASRSSDFRAGSLAGGRIPALATVDQLNRTETPLSNGGKWAKLNWANGTNPTGKDTTSGWAPYDAHPTVNGAYWKSATYNDGGAGDAVALTMQTAPGTVGHQVGIWLNMPEPGVAKSGYQVRWEAQAAANTYTLKLAKWVNGTETVLASNGSFTIAAGTTLALSDTGGRVAAWSGTGSSLNLALSASDSTYSSGSAGLSGTGENSRSINFKAGSLNLTIPDTSGLGPKGNVLPEAEFTLASTPSGLTFQCSMDGAGFSTCTSPKYYSGLSEGSHTFRSRAVDASGNFDPTPYTQTFQALEASKAIAKVPLRDNLTRNENPLATSVWSKFFGASQIGRTWSSADLQGYASSGGTLASAYWKSEKFNHLENGVFASAKVGSGAEPAGQHLALWLGAPKPETERTGFEARFEGVNGSASNYKVEIAKWNAGTRTVLATKAGVSLPEDQTIIFAASGLHLALWTGSGATYSQVLTATDPYLLIFSTGYPGLQASGVDGSLYDFRAGYADTTPPETSFAGNQPTKYIVTPIKITLLSNESPSTFECSMDAGAWTACSSPAEYKNLADGPHSFQTRAIDTVGNVDPTPAVLNFEMAVPPETTLTSPKPSFTNGNPSPATFTASEAGSTFECSLDSGAFTACTSPHSLPSNLSSESFHTFSVRAKDTNGNFDATPATWTFKTTNYLPGPDTSVMTTPENGFRTSGFYTLRAKWVAEGATGLTFQMKRATWQDFKTIPAEYVTDAQGQNITWPLPVGQSPGSSAPVYFDADKYPFPTKWYEEKLQMRAIFDGSPSSAGATQPVYTALSLRWGSSRNAKEQVGPVILDLLTGRYTLTRTDVSIPIPGSPAALEFSRTFSSAYHPSAPGDSVLDTWQPSAPVERETPALAWERLIKQHEPEIPAVIEEGEVIEEAVPPLDWIEVIDNDGGVLTFEYKNGTYVPPDDSPEWSLKTEGPTQMALMEPDGARTVFTEDPTYVNGEYRGATGNYRATEVSWQGVTQAAQMVYENTPAGQRLKRMIAPSPVDCGVTAAAEEKEGCRVLSFKYKPISAWEGLLSSERLASITYHTATGANGDDQVVSAYNYDASGELVEQWDPRIFPRLEERYTYETYGKLASLTPPGQQPWTFKYTGTPSEGRLKSVSRASLLTSPSVAQWTVAYNVPISGSGAPYDMSPATVAKWGQADLPRDATAIFPPDQVPADPPTSYSRAVVKYMNADGRVVNSASPAPPGVSGSVISTAEYDERGNAVRSLSPRARLIALASGENSVLRSHELESKDIYSADGTELLESWGPLHEVRFQYGTNAEARSHTVYKYDQGAPEPAAGEPAFHLPTKVTTGARVKNAESDTDSVVTQVKYNWDARVPIETIVDPLGLKLRSQTIYDSSTGMPVEQRTPADPEGKTAGTTKVVFYSPSGIDGGECKSTKWAYLPCKKFHAAAPAPLGGNADLPVVRYVGYTPLDQVTEIKETVGTTDSERSVKFTYGSAGRLVKSKMFGSGASLPASETIYSPTTGAAEKQQLVCEAPENCAGFDNQAVSTVYDTLGRVASYTDADGNTSTISYDLLNRPVTVTDGKGSQTMSYDPVSGLPVQLTDSAAGTFTATYDSEGNVLEQGLPNGLTQEIDYDEIGAPVHMRYQKTSNCLGNCTWLEFDLKESIHGQILKETSSASQQEYFYDKAGRLSLANDTPAGGSCTTRAYTYDSASNRTKMTTRAPGLGGTCDTTSTGTSTNYSYDTASRLIGEGIVYDEWGRITSLMGSYAGGSTYTASYYANDMVKSQSQGGITSTYFLDSMMRQRYRVQSGSESSTEIYHYSGGGDSPSWIDRGSSWQRNIPGLAGGLAAIQDSVGGTTLQLTDLRGNIVGTASLDPYATKPTETFEFDEFGNPKQTGTPAYGWLGSAERQTEFASGIMQLGARTYVPAMGRFTTPDAIEGGSSNAYDYANADPVNSVDLGGMKAKKGRIGLGRARAVSRPTGGGGGAAPSRAAGGGRGGTPRGIPIRKGSCLVAAKKPVKEFGTPSAGVYAGQEGIYIAGAVNVPGGTDCSDYRITVILYMWTGSEWRDMTPPNSESAFGDYGRGEYPRPPSNELLQSSWTLLECAPGTRMTFATGVVITKSGEQGWAHLDWVVIAVRNRLSFICDQAVAKPGGS